MQGFVSIVQIILIGHEYSDFPFLFLFLRLFPFFFLFLLYNDNDDYRSKARNYSSAGVLRSLLYRKIHERRDCGERKTAKRSGRLGMTNKYLRHTRQSYVGTCYCNEKQGRGWLMLKQPGRTGKYEDRECRDCTKKSQPFTRQVDLIETSGLSAFALSR